VLGLRWCRLDFQPPPPVDSPGAGEVARRFTWHCSLLLGTGITVGLCVVGAGGRLAMRLLAATAGDEAQGRITEAEEVVGRVTTDGTVGLVLFLGLFVGLITAAVYLLVRRLLPPRWVGGLAFGGGLLIVLGTTFDPLRDENPDFDIVGPTWLAVLVFTALALVYGVVLAAFVARLSRWLPLPASDRPTVLRYLPIALLTLGAFPFTILAVPVLVVVGLFVVAAHEWSPLVDALGSRAGVLVGRALLAALVLVSLPGAIQSITDIVNR
jgi:hypothetical protein